MKIRNVFAVKLSILLFLIAVFSVSESVFVSAQRENRTEESEQKIRRLDLAEAEAILRKDFGKLDELCAEDIIVNTPRNEIIRGRESLKDLIRRGVINYASFDREIETVAVYEKTAVVMGNETVVTNKTDVAAAQTVRRRFTNVWLRHGGKWLLTARHASIIASD